MQSIKSISRSPVRRLICLTAIASSMLAADIAQAVSCFPAKPLNTLLITSNFGLRKHPKLQGVTRLHAGSDLRAAIGTPLFAVEGGKITYAGYSASAGNFIMLLGDGGKVMRYLHASRLFVSTGDTVQPGQQIAQSGNTGEASAAPHLHFEVKLNGTKPTDPRPYLCNPAEKPGAGPDPKLNPGAPEPGTPGASPMTNGVPNNDYPPMGATPSAATAVPQASEMGELTNMSTQEFLQNESSRRFGNPQWYRDIRDPLDVLRNSPDPAVRAQAENMPPGDMQRMLYREIVFMQNLKSFMANENHERQQRMEQMMATDLADRVNIYSAQVLKALRQQALRSIK